MARERNYQCEWPTDCPFEATGQIKRGERSGWIRLCTHHLNQFMVMTNAECAKTWQQRHAPRSTRVNKTPGISIGARP